MGESGRAPAAKAIVKFGCARCGGPLPGRLLGGEILRCPKCGARHRLDPEQIAALAALEAKPAPVLRGGKGSVH